MRSNKLAGSVETRQCVLVDLASWRRLRACATLDASAVPLQGGSNQALALVKSVPQYLHLEPGATLPALVRQPTRVVVVLDQSVEPEWQHRVARWLVEVGCLYMLAWGRGCSSWDDAVDLANLEAFEYTDIPEESHAMTTWHADESLDECMWFAKNCSKHPVVHLERTIILHIGPTVREHELVGAYLDA